MLKSYYVEYSPKNTHKKHKESVSIFGTNKKEVDIVINFLYPFVRHSDGYEIKTGFVKSPSLEKEGKVKYLY